MIEAIFEIAQWVIIIYLLKPEWFPKIDLKGGQ